MAAANFDHDNAVEIDQLASAVAAQRALLDRTIIVEEFAYMEPDFADMFPVDVTPTHEATAQFTGRGG